MRKAQISVNLTWIFAVLAGIAVFALIIAFTNQQGGQSETEQGVTVLENFYTQLQSASSTTSFNTLDMPETTLSVTCQDYQTSSLSVDGAPTTRSLMHKPLFSRGEVTGREFFVWTKDWNMPTPVDRFTYLSTPRTLFLVINDSSTPGLYWKQFLSGFPDDFPTAVLNYNEIDGYRRGGYDRYRFIFFNEQVSRITAFQDEDIPLDAELDALNIKPGSHGLAAHGEVEFFDMGERFAPVHGYDITYIGEALMYGSVFTKAEAYECNQDKAFRRLRTHAEISINRSKELMQEMAGGHENCTNAWKSSIQEEQCSECIEIMRVLPSLYQELNQTDKSEAQRLYRNISQIKSVSDRLAQGRDCPTL